jgi:hypothetical protein
MMVIPLSVLSVPDEGYSTSVLSIPDEGYSTFCFERTG